ncbi:MAG: AMP-binding protein [Thermaerobacter sp.]|nr:AMP-binding protein [Thermaerobacter sp.]
MSRVANSGYRYRFGARPLHEYLRLHAQETPERTALIWYGRAVSFRELNDLSDRFACLLAEWGVIAGDRIALYLGNCPQFLVAFFGIQKIGAIVTPVSPAFKEWELQYQLNNSGVRVIVLSRDLYPVLASVRSQTAVTRVLVTDYRDFLPDSPTLPVPAEMLAAPPPTGDAADFMATVLATPANPPNPPLTLDQVSLMMYTSGTTGQPKGAMLTYGNALFKAAAGSLANGLTSADMSLAVMPLSHIAGLLVGLNMVIYQGASEVLLHRFDPEAAILAIEQYGCSWWFSVTPMNRAILGQLGAQHPRLTSLRHNLCTSFGMPLTEELAQSWRERTGGCIIHEASYGLTETHTADTFMPTDAIRWGTVGKPIADTDIRILDLETRQQCPVDMPGEIAVRNPGVFAGYWQAPEATAATMREGYLLTGDMGRVDADGYLYFLGRLKEMIKVSGYSVFPEEVESLLIRHPKIAQVAVIGVPHPQRGEVVKAYVVAKPGDVVSPQEIIDWSKTSMAHYKYPHEVEVVASLPATGTGKILRRVLKEQAQSGANPNRGQHG